ncbi:MAG TPA: TatD family hydrolase [Candidatus Bathyarchaeia archaeon]|jgi:TatD DNase family protein|nr:TatD family hydrolase [Candidatus Bathyarchaeia archaeon]
MRFVDAHIHLSDEEYSNIVDEIIADAKNANVVALVSNSMDLKTSIESLKLAEKNEGTVYAALGVHPWNVQALTETELQQTLDFILNQKGHKELAAIGEIGLDFKYEKIWDKQMKVFDDMLHLAEKLDLPAIIHSRGTTAQIVDMLPSYKLKKVLLHWFSNPISVLFKAVEKGYYITEGAPTAYSNGIRDVVRRVPLTNLLTETDGPVRFFKSPFDGKRTTPAFIPTVVKAIAEIKKMNVEEVAEQIISNFESFFEVRLN